MAVHAKILLLAVLALGATVDTVSAADELDTVAMVSVRGTDVRGQSVTRQGTAFLVGRQGLLLTSYHTVEPPVGGWGVDEFGVSKSQIVVLLRNKETALLTDARPASIKTFDGPTDAALLEVAGSSRSGVSTCPGAVAAMGESLLIVGVEPGRAGQAPSLDPHAGAASEPRASDAPFLRVSVATLPGFSGAPVFKYGATGDRQLVGLLKGGDPLNATVHSLVVPLAAMREKLIAACDVPCSHPDHGIDHYEVSQPGELHVSDWQRGGLDPTKYCDAFAAAERRTSPGRVITVTHAADNDHRMFTGMRDGQPIVREAQYKFECRVLYQSNPVYKVKLSPSCPAPANPLDLPR